MKYLVEILFFEDKRTVPLVVCDTEDKAQEWIDIKLRNGFYSGLGKFRIVKVGYYN